MRPEQTDSRFPTIVGVVAALGFLVTGLGAMVTPRTFFDAVATFDPYNQHFVQDIGAFNLGIGVTLLLAVRPASDGLMAALTGAAAASAAHVASHVVGHDLGGMPLVDIPMFAGLTALLVAAAIVRGRDTEQAHREIRDHRVPSSHDPGLS